MVIIEIIFVYCNLNDQIKLKTSSYNHSHLKIKNLFVKYPDNIKVFDNNNFMNIEQLYCILEIDQEGIQNLTRITNLGCSNNSKIKNINHMTNMIELYCHRDSGIDQEGIQNLTRITKINCNYNSKIKNINQMTNMIELDCGASGIDQEGIQNLIRITKLNCGNNSKI